MSTFKGYEVTFNTGGYFPVTERYPTLKAARRDMVDFLNESIRDGRLNAARGFKREGSVFKDNGARVIHKSDMYAPECSTYVSKLMYDSLVGFHTVSL